MLEETTKPLTLEQIKPTKGIKLFNTYSKSKWEYVGMVGDTHHLKCLEDGDYWSKGYLRIESKNEYVRKSMWVHM